MAKRAHPALRPGCCTLQVIPLGRSQTRLEVLVPRPPVPPLRLTYSYSVLRPGSVSSLSTRPPFTQRWPVISVVLWFRAQVRRVLGPTASTDVQTLLPGGRVR